MKSKPRQPYPCVAVLLMVICPLASIAVQALITRTAGNPWVLISTWFLFWSLGVRFFTAGLNQVFRPNFTAESIFKIKNSESYVIVRELGFANVCTGALCLISVFVPSWRLPAAFTGDLFLGIAGINHAIKGTVSLNEKIAMATDLFVFIVVAAFLINSIL